MSRLSETIVTSIRKALSPSREVLVVSHVAPDGDAISSLAATGLALSQLDKRFTLVCDDGLPARFSFLPLSDRIHSRPDPDLTYDLLIALDCGDKERLGRAYADLSQPVPLTINIDHHITNTEFGDINLVQPKAAATVEILFYLFQELGLTIDDDMAVALLSGLVTDTLNFRVASVTAETLQVASTLVEAGADLYSVASKAMHLKQLSTLLIWQKGLSNLKMEDGLVWTAISNRERAEAGHNGTSSFGLGNMMADVYGAAMSAVLLELADNRVSVGFRCRPPFRVSDIAQSLGGGGHHLAAGCTLDGPLAAAEALVVGRSIEAIRRQKAELQDGVETAS